MKSFKIDTIFSNGQICDLFDLVEFKLQLDRTASARTRKINLSANQKGYDKSETLYEKLSARRIQICGDYFCVIKISPIFIK